MNVKILTKEDLEHSVEAELVLIDTGATFRGQAIYLASNGSRKKDLLDYKLFQKHVVRAINPTLDKW